MTTSAEVASLLERLRHSGAEPEDLEVKSGLGAFPRSLRETVVAFANGQGGTILVGVDEDAEDAVVPVADVASCRDRIAQLTRDDLTPALSVSTDLVPIKGGAVLVVKTPQPRLARSRST